ncbi:hypothetical protein GGR57DRAFT_509506 [Xylariaceae sp. FL1272]|nr:hypothetical protein GGR57DRAFT_509506 [Xylariaceae sp. FL1272]
MTPEVRKENPGWDAIRINKHLGPIWRAKTNAERSPWTERAEILKKEHAVQFPNWKKKGGKRTKPPTTQAMAASKKQKVSAVPQLDRPNVMHHAEGKKNQPEHNAHNEMHQTESNNNGSMPADDFSSILRELQEYSGVPQPGFFEEAFTAMMGEDAHMDPSDSQCA